VVVANILATESKLVGRREIARPVEAVADYAGDPSNAPTWYQNIDSVAWETEPPPRVGSRVRFVARFLGRRLTYTYELVELERPCPVEWWK